MYEMDFTLRLGHFSIYWQARIEDVSQTGFKDTQVQGPFVHWVHTHTFEPIDTQRTRVIDHIDQVQADHAVCRRLNGEIELPGQVILERWRFGDKGLEVRRFTIRAAADTAALPGAGAERIAAQVGEVKLSVGADGVSSLKRLLTET